MQTGPAGDDALTARLMSTISAMAAGARMGSSQRHDAERFALNVLQNTTTGRPPDDLFHPRSGQASKTDSFDLAGGMKGAITVTIDARTDPASGLMISLERTVVTTVGTDRGVSHELWTLAPDSAGD